MIYVQNSNWVQFNPNRIVFVYVYLCVLPYSSTVFWLIAIKYYSSGIDLIVVDLILAQSRLNTDITTGLGGLI